MMFHKRLNDLSERKWKKNPTSYEKKCTKIAILFKNYVKLKRTLGERHFKKKVKKFVEVKQLYLKSHSLSKTTAKVSTLILWAQSLSVLDVQRRNKPCDYLTSWVDIVFLFLLENIKIHKHNHCICLDIFPKQNSIKNMAEAPSLKLCICDVFLSYSLLSWSKLFKCS